MVINYWSLECKSKSFICAGLTNITSIIIFGTFVLLNLIYSISRANWLEGVGFYLGILEFTLVRWVDFTTRRSCPWAFTSSGKIGVVSMLTVNVWCFMFDKSLHSYHSITQKERTHRTLMQHIYLYNHYLNIP